MLLACDIGNSYISLGIFDGLELKDSFSIPTDKSAGPQDYLQTVKSKISQRLDIDRLIIASVVPDLTKSVATALGLALEIPPRIITNKDIPVLNKYSIPETVGVDRLLNAYAALQSYAAPLIIVDFGTATTFDVVSGDKEYLGGSIVPGVEASLEALFGKAARLDSVQLSKPSETIGHSTEESIRSGVVIGTAGLVDKLITEIETELGASTHIATGGLAELIIPYCETVEIIEPHLTLTGIALLA